MLHVFRGTSSLKLCDGLNSKDARDGRCVNCSQLRALEPRELMIRLGHITSWVLRGPICGGDKACERRFVSRLKKMGARYDDGGGWLYPSWNWGIPDLHWHPGDALLGSPGQTKREFYLERLQEADVKLLLQSLSHEEVLRRLGQENWVSEVEEELRNRIPKEKP